MAAEMRISHWSSDVCSSDLERSRPAHDCDPGRSARGAADQPARSLVGALAARGGGRCAPRPAACRRAARFAGARGPCRDGGPRSEEHTSELQSLMRISYAVFCLKKKKKKIMRKTVVDETQTYNQ